MTAEGLSTGPHRRLIAADDLPALAAQLALAFPRRREAMWRVGLERLGECDPPPGLPRYGILIEAGKRIVGAVLTICAEVEEGGCSAPRCHLSSWFIEPAFAAHAPLLIAPLLRRPDLTMVNISPAAHTEAIIERQGFRTFCRGSLLVLPLLALPLLGPRSATVRALQPADAATPAEQRLIDTHLRWGCRCLAVVHAGRVLPFIFAPPRRLRGFLPASQLLFCRDLDGFAAHSGALGQALLRMGIVAVLVNSAAPIPGLPARRVAGWQGRYWRGPRPPRPGDLAYSELALFPDHAERQHGR